MIAHAAEAARKLWLELTSNYPSDRNERRTRRLVMQHMPSLGRQMPVDQLLLHAMAIGIDDDVAIAIEAAVSPH